MSFLKFLIKRHPVMAVLFVVALAGVVAFSWRFVSDALYFNDPAHHNQSLEPWMTPRYVGMSWDLPPEVIGPLMGLSKDMPRDGKPPRLDDIAANLGITLEDLQARVEAAKAEFYAGHRRPGGPGAPEDQGADQ